MTNHRTTSRIFAICLLSVILLVTAAAFGDAGDGDQPSSKPAEGPHADVEVHTQTVLAQNRGLGWPDWTVIGLYGGFMIGVGWFYSRRQTSTEEYFLGSRRMKPFAIGISTFATLLSTISYLASPGEMIKHGPVVLSGLLAGPIIFGVVGYALIPFLVKLRISSAYEILGNRLGAQVRLLGSSIFILTRLIWMALLIYLAAKAMVTMLGWRMSTIPYVVIVAGLVAVAYTVLGGLRAVVITDVFQFFILLGGALLTIFFVSVKLGGVGAWWPTEWAQNWDDQPFFSWDPAVRATVVGAIVANFTWWTCTAGSDQVVIQRYLATRDAITARRSFLINICADAVVGILLAIVGFAVLGFFRTNPQCLPEGGSLVKGADYLFPHYIANYLPVGIAGLVVAAMFAAAMSSLDSGINSIVSVVTNDFILRFRKATGTERHVVKLAKYLVLGIGIVIVLISSMIGKVPGNIMEVTTKTNGLFVGPLFGLFFMALFVPFANQLGAFFGAIYGFVTAAIIGYWDVMTGNPALSFQLVIVSSVVVHIVIGSLISLLSRLWKTRLGMVFWSLLATAPLAVIVTMLVQCGTSQS